jgi:hypothetical protein
MHALPPQVSVTPHCHMMFLAFLRVLEVRYEETVRIFQEQSDKDATESNKTEENEIIIKYDHRSEYEQNGLKNTRVNNLPAIQNYCMDLT